MKVLPFTSSWTFTAERVMKFGNGFKLTDKDDFMCHVKKTMVMAIMLVVNGQVIAASYPSNPNPYNYSCKQIVPAICATEADTPESLMHGPPVRPRYHFVRQGKDFCSGYLYYPLGFAIDTVPAGVEVPVVGLNVGEWGKLGWYPLIDLP